MVPMTNRCSTDSLGPTGPPCGCGVGLVTGGRSSGSWVLAGTLGQAFGGDGTGTDVGPITGWERDQTERMGRKRRDCEPRTLSASAGTPAMSPAPTLHASQAAPATLRDGDLEAQQFLNMDRDFETWRRQTQSGPGAGRTMS